MTIQQDTAAPAAAGPLPRSTALYRQVVTATEALTNAVGDVARAGSDPVLGARDALLVLVAEQVMPRLGGHAELLGPAVEPRAGELLLPVLSGLRRRIEAMAVQLSAQTSPVRVSGSAQALRTLVEAYLAIVDDQVVPHLAARDASATAALLAAVEERVVPVAAETSGGCSGCGCGSGGCGGGGGGGKGGSAEG